MINPTIIRNRGTIVARAGTGLLFIESPEHYYAVGNVNKVQLQVGDVVEFEAIFGDQCADVTARTRRAGP